MIDNQDGFASFDRLIEAAPEIPSAAVVPISAAAADGIPAISSLEIARITGKNHADVMRDIRTVFEQAEISLSKFASSYFNTRNKEQPCYLLPRRESDLVVSGYSVKYRLAIIDRWHELEAERAQAPAIAVPQTFRDALLIALKLQDEVDALKPKSDALDRIAGTEGLMNITVAAKTLQVQPKALFAWLSREDWIYRRHGSNEWVPYQHRIQSGHMVAKAHTITNQVTGEEMIKERALITAKGLAKLAENFEKKEVKP